MTPRQPGGGGKRVAGGADPAVRLIAIAHKAFGTDRRGRDVIESDIGLGQGKWIRARNASRKLRTGLVRPDVFVAQASKPAVSGFPDPRALPRSCAGDLACGPPTWESALQQTRRSALRPSWWRAAGWRGTGEACTRPRYETGTPDGPGAGGGQDERASLVGDIGREQDQARLSPRRVARLASARLNTWSSIPKTRAAFAGMWRFSRSRPPIKDTRIQQSGSVDAIGLSCQDLAGDLTRHVRQPEVTSGVAVSELFVIEAHQAQERGVQVVGVQPALDRLDAKLVVARS